MEQILLAQGLQGFVELLPSPRSGERTLALPLHRSWGMFSEGRGGEFYLPWLWEGRSRYFGFFCLIWVCQDPVSKAPGAELFFLFRGWQVG